MKTYLGYKNHVIADAKSKFISDYEVTSTVVHDSRALKELLKPEDKHQSLYGDSAYRSDEIESLLMKKR